MTQRYDPYDADTPRPRFNLKRDRKPTPTPQGRAPGRTNNSNQAPEASVTEAKALERAVTQDSTANYQTIIDGFVAIGIPAAEIKPRENVFTFRAWIAAGRCVRKGQHGVKITTMIPRGEPDSTTDLETGAVVVRQKTRPWTTTVFHISQTDPLTDNQPAAVQLAKATPTPIASPSAAPIAANVVPVQFTEARREIVPIPARRPTWRERYAACMNPGGNQ